MILAFVAGERAARPWRARRGRPLQALALEATSASTFLSSCSRRSGAAGRISPSTSTLIASVSSPARWRRPSAHGSPPAQPVVQRDKLSPIRFLEAPSCVKEPWQNRHASAPV